MNDNRTQDEVNRDYKDDVYLLMEKDIIEPHCAGMLHFNRELAEVTTLFLY